MQAASLTFATTGTWKLNSFNSTSGTYSAAWLPGMAPVVNAPVMTAGSIAQKPEHAEEATSILVDEGVITPDALRAMAEAANKIKLDSSIAKKDWAKMADQLEQTHNLSAEDMLAVRDFAAGVKQFHTQLHREFRAADYDMKAKVEGSNRTISSQLEDVHVFLDRIKEPSTAYLETAAKVAIQGLAPASFGPTGTLAAYVAWTGQNQAEVQSLVKQLESLQDRNNPVFLHGNKVEPVHGEKLWQAKMNLLDDAYASASGGQPVEIDAQYFELTSDHFVAKLAQCAQAGCKVRINIDPSRPTAGDVHSIDDGPKKLRALLQLARTENADIGVSMYPVAKNLGNLTQLMHRKMLRVGEKVLLGGMNANRGSGDNVDAGFVIQGPAARQLTEFFARDARQSADASTADIFGDEELTAFLGKDVTMSPRGLLALLDCVNGPDAPGTLIPNSPSFKEIATAAEEAGVKVNDLVTGGKELPNIIADAASDRVPLQLKKEGKRLFADMVQKVMNHIHTAENLEALEDITLPEGKVAGNVTMALGDDPVEREALLLDTIGKEDKFIYIPTFVITKPVARALIARRDELKAQGKALDIKVIADPGIYGYGGTPNEAGVLELEDAGIPVRWALLPRPERSHDRKVHAKQVLTSKAEFVGSTNLSHKGLKDNWELSGVMYFDPADPQAMAARDDTKARFERMWEYESFELDTRKVADRRVPDEGQKDRPMRVQESRGSAVRSLLNRIKQYECETADWLQQWKMDMFVSGTAHELEVAGVSPGYALMMAVEQQLGTEEFYARLHELPGYQKLEKFRDGELDWSREKV